MQAIYAIINLKNGKKYIGSAVSFHRRKIKHLGQLKNNKHHSPSLQNSGNKNNPDDYRFIVLEKITDNSILLEREQYYLDYFKTYEKEFGYNICTIAGNPSAHKLYKHIFKFTMSGEFVEEYDNAALAARSVNSPECSSSISRCCNCKYRFGKDHIFSYDSTITQERIDFANNPRLVSDEKKINMSIAAKNKKMRAIVQFDLYGNFLKEGPCTRDACSELKLSCGQISDCLNGKHNQARGFRGMFKDKLINENNIENEKI